MLWLCFELPICLFDQGHVCTLRESKSYLIHLHATSKNEIQICSNIQETGLVYMYTYVNVSVQLSGRVLCIQQFLAIFDLLNRCVYFIQQQMYKQYTAYFFIISVV